MRKVEHTVSLFFIDFSKIAIVDQIIKAHKEIYNLFGYGIYHKPHYIFNSKCYEFHNRNICLFSGYNTRMGGYFIGMNRDLIMRKGLLDTV